MKTTASSIRKSILPMAIGACMALAGGASSAMAASPQSATQQTQPPQTQTQRQQTQPPQRTQTQRTQRQRTQSRGNQMQNNQSSDKMITRKAKRALAGNQATANVNVRATNGVIHLTGTVDSMDTRDQAVKKLRKIDGVQRVDATMLQIK